MRLLALTVDWEPIEGGIATLARGLSRALARRGHPVRVLAPRVAGEPAIEEHDGLVVERWPGYGLGLLRWLPFAASARRALGETDLVLAFNPAYGGVVSALAAARGGPPFLAWTYGFELRKARRTPLAPVLRAALRGARAVVAISRATAADAVSLGVPGERLRVVFPGVEEPLPTWPSPAELRARLSLPSGPVVLTVGRLIARKGHLTLLEALPRILAACPDAVWVVVGRGPLEAAIAARAAELGVAPRVRLLGYLDPFHLEGLYRMARVFSLLPAESRRDVEGFGIVYLEAGLRGVPVVAARSGGIEDAVEDGETGLLVPPGQPGEAAAAIVRLLCDADLAHRLGEQGRARASARSWERVAAEVEALFP